MKSKIIIIIIAILLIIAIVIVYKNVNENKYQIPVLVYHHFLTKEEEDLYQEDKSYCISTENFEKEMKYLYDNGYKSLTLDELYAIKTKKQKVPDKSFVITIDDGLTSAYYRARPILGKYGFTATVFIIGSATNQTTNIVFDPTTYQYIGEDLINSQDKVLDYGIHSFDMHKLVDNKAIIFKLNKKEILEDLTKAKETINSDYFCDPYYTYKRKLISALKEADYKMAFRGGDRKTVQYESLYLISRISVSSNEDVDKFYKIFETSEYNFKFKIKRFASDMLKTYFN